MNKLIFGKNQLTNIVALEVNDNKVEIFQEIDGKITSIIQDNSFWILAPIQFDLSWIRLNGNLHYKWGKQYSNRKDYMEARRSFHNLDSYSVYDEREACLMKDGYTYLKGMTPNQVSICAIDIETTGLDPLLKDAKVLLITNTLRINGQITRKLFAYDEYNSEAEMLQDWCLWINAMNPSIIVGHNLFGFDLMYLFERARKKGVELTLGRDGSCLKKGNYEKKFRVDGTRDLSYFDYRIYGREIIDTMHLAYKYDIGRKYASYGLKKIIEQEGWEQPNRVFYDAGQIRFNYKDPEEWLKIKQYCGNDGDDALTLFDKMIPPFFYQTQSIAKPLQSVIQSASGSQLNSIMIRAYLQDGHSLPKADEVNEFQGAISFGVPGLYKNAIRFDFSAMYPSIMLQYNIHDKKKDPNNCLIQLLTYLRTERLQNKKLAKETGNIYYKHMEQSQKLMINSSYGFLSTRGLLFNYPQGAAEITKKGRELLAQCIKWASGQELEKYIK